MDYEDQGVDMLSRHLPKLKEIEAPNCGLGLESADYVSRRLPLSTVLDLKGNQIGRGAISFCRLSHLKELRLEQTGLVDWIAVMLATLLTGLELLTISRQVRSELCIFMLRQVLKPGVKLS